MAGLPKKRGHRLLHGKTPSERRSNDPFQASSQKSFPPFDFFFVVWVLPNACSAACPLSETSVSLLRVPGRSCDHRKHSRSLSFKSSKCQACRPLLCVERTVAISRAPIMSQIAILVVFEGMLNQV